MPDMPSHRIATTLEAFGMPEVLLDPRKVSFADVDLTRIRDQSGPATAMIICDGQKLTFEFDEEETAKNFLKWLLISINNQPPR